MHKSYTISSIIFLAITVLGLSRIYETLPAQAIGITVFSLIAILLLCYFKIPSLNSEIRNLSSEKLILLHTIRAPIGASFIVMWQDGLMPERFAMLAGWGDILVRILAPVCVLMLNSKTFKNQRLRLILTFNVIGFVDLALAVGTGLSLGLANQASMIWISKLPLLLVPCFLVPVLMTSHIILFMRIFRKETQVVETQRLQPA